MGSASRSFDRLRASLPWMRGSCRVALALLAIQPAAAQDPAGFSAWDVQLLHGRKFEEPASADDVAKTLVTFENSSAWSWGSSYFFVDLLKSDGEDDHATEVYAEWYPSASIGKLSGSAIQFGPLRDISVTLGLNAGTKSTGADPLIYLPGFTFDLNIPGFRFFTLGTYAYVDDGRIDGDSNGCHDTGYQITPSWSLPIELGSVHMSFDGFIDFIGAHGECDHQIVSQPQLKLDIGNFWGTPNKLYAGVEWQYWQSKFGIDGLDESFPQAMIQLNF